MLLELALAMYDSVKVESDSSPAAMETTASPLPWQEDTRPGDGAPVLEDEGELPPAHDNELAPDEAGGFPDTAAPATHTKGLPLLMIQQAPFEPDLDDTFGPHVVSGSADMNNLIYDMLRFHLEDEREADHWTMEKVLQKAICHYLHVQGKVPPKSEAKAKTTWQASWWTQPSHQWHDWPSHQTGNQSHGSSWCKNATDASSHWSASDWATGSSAGWQDGAHQEQAHSWPAKKQKTTLRIHTSTFEHECKHILADICFFGICLPLARFLLDSCGYPLAALPSFLVKSRRVGDRFDSLTALFVQYQKLRAHHLGDHPHSSSVECKAPLGKIHFRGFFDWDIVRAFGMKQLHNIIDEVYPWRADGRAFDQYHTHGARHGQSMQQPDHPFYEGTKGHNNPDCPWPPKEIDPYVLDDILLTMRCSYEVLVNISQEKLERKLSDLQGVSHSSASGLDRRIRAPN
jgi:hypothetical protein